MRPLITAARLCLRQTIPRVSTRSVHASKRAYRHNWQSAFRTPARKSGIVILAASAGLSPAVFVQLSEEDNAGTDQTAEGRMLDASREELKKEVSKDVHGLRRLRDTIVLYVDVYLWEPLCTGLRFLHLVVIFVPVILTVPTIWFGARDKQRSDERSGTLWWYWFLVRSMERAGPAFIKVSSTITTGRRRGM
jgi:aarF domain-containing kinase